MGKGMPNDADPGREKRPSEETEGRGRMVLQLVKLH